LSLTVFSPPTPSQTTCLQSLFVWFPVAVPSAVSCEAHIPIAQLHLRQSVLAGQSLGFMHAIPPVLLELATEEDDAVAPPPMPPEPPGPTLVVLLEAASPVPPAPLDGSN